ncbi:hypothetical protein [Chryseobacterium lactis]|uniref:hypothetical protein n=1 Tax=Chryseobacterium lactis TaxID=1241981 RepID=UPI0016252D45|nr:hypothetical protein [Chryseobacterium lactis]
MKHFSKFLLIAFVCSVLFSCQKQKSEIHYIGLYTTTITSLSCADLKKATHKTDLTLSEKENNELMQLFSRLKLAANDVNIDARLYGSIINEKKENLNFCMNLGFIELNGKKYVVDDELREYILKLTERKK